MRCANRICRLPEHATAGNLEVGGKSDELLPGELLPHKHLASRAKRHEMERCLPSSMRTECICTSMILLLKGCHICHPQIAGEYSGGQSH